MVMIMQHCEYTKNHGILYFKMVSFMFSEFNLYKNCKKKILKDPNYPMEGKKYRKTIEANDHFFHILFNMWGKQF